MHSGQSPHRPALCNPFGRDGDLLINRTEKYQLPPDGRINGYVKVRRLVSKRTAEEEQTWRILVNGDSTAHAKPMYSVTQDNPSSDTSGGDSGTCGNGKAGLNHPWPTNWHHMGSPSMVPQNFGLGSKMDHMDRRIWSFCE